MLAGAKPSKVAARLSLADWLLVVLPGTGTSVSSSIVDITDATVALVRALIMGDMVVRSVLWVKLGDKSLTAVSKHSSILLVGGGYCSILLPHSHRYS